MNLFHLLDYIMYASEGDSKHTRTLCDEAGLDDRITRMLVTGVENVNDSKYRDALEDVISWRSQFWKAIAFARKGAICTDTGARVKYFNYAIDIAGTIPNVLDREYIKNYANAGLRDTPRGCAIESLDDIVGWMTTHGVYNAPGRANVLIRKLLEADDRQHALRVYMRLLSRMEEPMALFSRRQMARLEQTIDENFRRD